MTTPGEVLRSSRGQLVARPHGRGGELLLQAEEKGEGRDLTCG